MIIFVVSLFMMGKSQKVEDIKPNKGTKLGYDHVLLTT
jgi:hypothetical protein